MRAANPSTPLHAVRALQAFSDDQRTSRLPRILRTTASPGCGTSIRSGKSLAVIATATVQLFGLVDFVNILTDLPRACASRR